MAIERLAHRDEAGGDVVGTAAGRDGGTLAAWARRHPVGAYLAWFYAVVWAISFIPIVARHALHLDVPAWALQLFINAASLLGICLPAVLVTRLVDGPAGVRALLGRALAVRVPAGWYAVALLAMPVPAVLLAVTLYGRPDATASALLGALAYGFLLQTVVGLLLNNLWEEVGVMGFLQARLQARHGALLGAAITAPLFALQHLALLVGDGLVSGLALVLLVSVLFVPYRALMGWMYNRTGSLFLVGLLHAAGNAAAAGAGFGASFLRQLYATEDVGAFHTLAAALLGLALIAATRGQLGYRSERAIPAAPSVEAAVAGAPSPAAGRG
jgi:membrane protease YdiL (CAAX protease family)